MEKIIIDSKTLDKFKNINNFIVNNSGKSFYFDFSQMKTEKVYIAGINDHTDNKNLIQCLYPGGVIILSNQDILFLYTNSYCIEGLIKENIRKLISSLNKEFSYKFSLNNNDIIVNDIYKIGSFSSWEYNNIWATGLFFSFNNNQEEISKHCHKTQKYQSIGINNLNIDVNIIKNKINELFGIDWQKQYERMQNEYRTKIK